MFDTALGLPLHPLLVHLPIVLLPLSAVGVVLLVVAPSLRRRLAVPTLILLAVGALGSIAAMLSGNALAERVGQPGGHAQLGTALVVASICYCCSQEGGCWVRPAQSVRECSPAPSAGSRPLRQSASSR